MMIECDKITKYFGPVLAVDRMSFEVDRGEVVGFLGPNGAGKTTTMRILTSYLPATSGIAKIAGHDVMTESMEVRRNIGYLPESVPLYPEMRVEEYLTYRAKLKQVPRKERAGRVEFCLERCRLREVRRRLAGTLSKGYRQRVGLADAMIHDPPLLILDEPTTGLDPIQIRETLSLIKELGDQHTVLLSSHILVEVEDVCERFIIIGYGRLLLNKTLDDLEADAMILMEVRGPGDQIQSALHHVPGVTEVIPRAAADGLASFEIRTAREQDPREAISKAIIARGWTVRRLERNRPLDHAFFQVMRGDDPHKTPAAAPKLSEAIQPAPQEAITS